MEHSDSNEAWRRAWLKDVEKVLYSADDILDEIAICMLKYKVTDGEDGEVRRSIITSNVEIPRKVKKYADELDDHAKEMDVPFMAELSRVGSFNAVSRCHYYSCGTSSLVDETILVGRKERDEINNWLLSCDVNANNVSVMPVVGMGDIGKTTLTQVVYHDCSLA